jgi:hypothetical protein
MTSPFIQFLVNMRYDTFDSGRPAAEILDWLSNKYLSVSASFSVPRDWPRSARGVTSLLERDAPGLRALGWCISNDGGKNIDNRVRWRLHPPSVLRGEGDELTSDL